MPRRAETGANRLRRNIFGGRVKTYERTRRRLRLRATLSGAAAVLALLAAGAAAAQDASDADAAAPGDAAEEGASSGGEVRFDVMEYAVSGNSVLTAGDIQRVLMPYTGYGKQVSDVVAGQRALEALYRERGYPTVVVDVPQQDVSSGIIAMVVTEGRVGTVAVTGAQHASAREVRQSLPGLTPGSVPHVPSLQAQMARSNTRGTRTVRPEFRAGAAPGTVDVDLAVEDRRVWGASVELNDQYNRSTERLRVSASAHYDDLWRAGHSVNLSYQFSPEEPGQVQAVSGSYYAPIGYSRTSLLAYAVRSNTDVATLGGLTVIGEGTNIGGRIIHTLAGSPAGVVQSVMLGADYKDYFDQIGLVDPATEELLTFDTPVTYLPFTAQYRWLKAREDYQAEFSLGTTFAFDGLVGRQAQFGGVPDDPLVPGNQGVPGKRDNAQASFLFFYGNASYAHRFGAIDAKLAVDWQLATDPLISNEQFVLGGLASVRGYREAEALGDSGARASVEVGYSLRPARGVDWRIAGFAEGGYGWVERPLPEELHSYSLSSVGVSNSVSLFDLVYGQFDLAYQFQEDPAKNGVPVDDDIGGMRVHFKVGVKY